MKNLRFLFIISIAFIVLKSTAKEGKPLHFRESKILNETESKALGLKAVELNGYKFMPRHDGKRFIIDMNPAPIDTIAKKSKYTKVSITSAYEKSRDAIIAAIDLQKTYTLPQMIEKEIGGKKYGIVIDTIKFTPTGNRFSACLFFESGESSFYFGADNVPFTGSGGLDNGSARLSLVEATLKPSGSTQNTGTEYSILDDGKTYIEFDCKGFVSMGLGVKVAFSRNFMIPEDLSGNTIPAPQKVQGTFAIQNAKSFDDLYAEISFSNSFQLTKLPNYGFQISKAYIDLSHSGSAPGMQFPIGYNISDNYISQEDWTGIALYGLKVRLPSEFAKNDTDKAKEFGASLAAQFMIIDEMGITGSVEGQNLIRDGKLGTWKFNLLDLKLVLLKSSITTLSFDGNVNLPLQEKNQTINYKASFLGKESSYVLDLNTKDKGISFPAFGASKVNLKQAKIELQSIGNKTIPTATLSGSFDIGVSKPNSTNGEKVFSAGGVEFRDLSITTVAPYLKGGTLEFSKSEGKKMGNFPLTIGEETALSVSGENISINVGLNINLMGAESNPKTETTTGQTNSFSAKALLKINAKIVTDIDEGQNWQYKNVELTRADVDVDVSAFHLKGSILFFEDDPVYGNGFNGNLSLELKKPAIKVSASAIFGATPTFRYWYADALADGLNIPMGPAISLTGLGGGAFRKMRQISAGEAQNLPLKAKSASGLIYVPDDNIGFGFRVYTKAFCGIGGGKLLDADVALEVTFQATGGLSKISMLGHANMLAPGIKITASEMAQKAQSMAKATSKLMDANGNITPVADGSKSSNADSKQAKEMDKALSTEGSSTPMYATVFFEYDHVKEIFNGNLAVTMKTPMMYTTQNSRADIYFSSEKWYIFIGRMEEKERFGLNIAGLASTNAYFMVGNTDIGEPSIPSSLESYLNSGSIYQDKPKYVSSIVTEKKSIAEGEGIAFGASAAIKVNEKVLIVYFKLDAIVGFDLALKNYADAKCEGSNEAIGISGWRAAAQAYAFLDGDMGVGVSLGPLKKNIPIAKLKLGALLQAKLPNPSFFIAALKIEVNVLNGLIHKTVDAKLQLGTKCEIIGSDEEKISLISKIGTEDTGIESKGVEENISVVSPIKTNFSVPMAKPFEENEKNIKPELENIKVVNEKNEEIAGKISYNKDKTEATFTPLNAYPANTKLKATAIVAYKKEENGTWVLINEGNENAKETKNYEFITGSMPSNIIDSDIDFGYPYPNQYSFFKKEAKDGKSYLKLKILRWSIFNELGKCTLKGKLTHVKTGKVDDIALDFDDDLKKQISFVLPSNLENNAVYQFKVMKEYIDGTSPSAEVYSYFFKTSEFDTFSDKIGYINKNGIEKTTTGGIILKEVEKFEPFDNSELTSAGGNQIKMQAETNNEWFKKISTDTYFGKTVNIEPNMGVSIMQSNYVSISNEEQKTGLVDDKSKQTIGIVYSVFNTLLIQYQMRKAEVAQTMSSGNSSFPPNQNSPVYKTTPASTLLDLLPIKYGIGISYTLPGQSDINSATTIYVENKAVPCIAIIDNKSPLVKASGIVNLELSSKGAIESNWAGPNSFRSQNKDVVLSGATASMSGVYSVTVKNGATCSATASTSVLIEQEQTTTVTPTTTVQPTNPTTTTPTTTVQPTNPPATTTCGITVSIKNTFPTIAYGEAILLEAISEAANKFEWKGPDGFVSTEKTISIYGVSPANSGTYILKINGKAECTASANVRVANKTPETVTGPQITPVSPPTIQLPDVSTLKITFSKNKVAIGDTLTAFAEGCKGTVIWSIGDATGNRLVITAVKNNAVTIKCKIGESLSGKSYLFRYQTFSIDSPTIVASKNPVCSGDLTLLSVRGCPGKAIWSTGQTASQIEVSPTQQSSYTARCYFEDAQGPASAPLNLSVSLSPSQMLSSNSPVCLSQTLKLEAKGVENVTWEGPAGFNSSSKTPERALFTNAMAGIYVVKATMGDCITMASINVATNQPPYIDFNNPFQHIPCGDPMVIQASYRVQPGCKFLWTGPNNFTSYSDNPVVTEHASDKIHSGVYQVKVTSPDGCIAEKSIQMVVTECPILRSPNVEINTPLLCVGESTTIRAIGCPSDVVWNTGEKGIELKISPIQTTGYSAHCDHRGILGPESVLYQIAVKPYPTLMVTSNSPICEGSKLDLKCNSNASAFLWKGPNGFNSTEKEASIQNTTLHGAGIYTIITNQNNCNATTTLSVEIHTPPILKLDATAKEVACGQKITVNALNTENLKGIETFSWTGPKGFKSAWGEVTISRAADQSHNGTYNVKVTSPSGCKTTGSVDVKVVCKADLTIITDILYDTVLSGDVVYITVAVSNDGPNAATNVKVRDVLPAGMTYVTGPYAELGSPVHNAGVVTGTIATIPPGQTRLVRFNVKITGTVNQLLISAAEVWSCDQQDPDSTPGNGVMTEDDYDIKGVRIVGLPK